MEQGQAGRAEAGHPASVVRLTVPFKLYIANFGAHSFSKVRRPLFGTVRVLVRHRCRAGGLRRCAWRPTHTQRAPLLTDGNATMATRGPRPQPPSCPPRCRPAASWSSPTARRWGPPDSLLAWGVHRWGWPSAGWDRSARTLARAQVAPAHACRLQVPHSAGAVRSGARLARRRLQRHLVRRCR